jgi:hypothetical protein
MSVRIEWLDSANTIVEVLLNGQTISGEETVGGSPTPFDSDTVTGEAALVLSADNVVVIEGDAQDLLYLLDDLREQLTTAYPRLRSA